MHLGSTLPAGPGRTDRRRKAILIGKFAAVLLAPLILIAFPSDPPVDESGIASINAGSSCGTSSCHFHGSTSSGTSGVTVTFPSGLTYTPGGPAISLTVALNS